MLRGFTENCPGLSVLVWIEQFRLVLRVSLNRELASLCAWAQRWAPCRAKAQYPCTIFWGGEGGGGGELNFMSNKSRVSKMEIWRSGQFSLLPASCQINKSRVSKMEIWRSGQFSLLPASCQINKSRVSKMEIWRSGEFSLLPASCQINKSRVSKMEIWRSGQFSLLPAS